LRVIAAERELLILPLRRLSLIDADTPFVAFQDRRIQPLCHLSIVDVGLISFGFALDRSPRMLPVALWLHLAGATALGTGLFRSDRPGCLDPT
jgi:hypothetical protein